MAIPIHKPAQSSGYLRCLLGSVSKLSWGKVSHKYSTISGLVQGKIYRRPCFLPWKTGYPVDFLLNPSNHTMNADHFCVKPMDFHYVNVPFSATLKKPRDHKLG